MDIHIEELSAEDEQKVEAFLLEFLDMDSVMVTHYSTLSDFTGRGLSTEQIDSTNTYHDLCDLWDKIILQKFKHKYGFELEKTSIQLWKIVELIEQNENKIFH